MRELLIVNEVSKSFGLVLAVYKVSFSVNEQEIFGIAGPNGAGKTTLFNAISGIPYPPDAGQILFDGAAIHNLGAHAIARMGIARTFQRETVFESLSVLDNVRVGAVYGRSANDRHRPAREAAAEALAAVGLYDKRAELARNLSLFDKKKLMLASALVMRPRLLLLDELAAGLNQIEIEQTIQLIRSIHEQGITVILIEHVLPLLLALSQRIMILDHGEKLCEGPPHQVVHDERVIEAYLGRRGVREHVFA